ncbi:hypothetical protein BU15DRAFT_70255 [Melanogaster broomeanus]|nr:hypothetical protein BU15DRAFT_70255 [Melanogaster broomeanus]
MRPPDALRPLLDLTNDQNFHPLGGLSGPVGLVGHLVQTTSNSCSNVHCDMLARLQLGFSIPALPQGEEYTAPSGTNANRCECNTVAYSLVSACAACQDANYISWPAWIINCNATAVRQVAFFLLAKHIVIGFSSLPEAPPPGTVVPPWAFISVNQNGTWNATAASLNATSIPTTTSSLAPQSTSTAAPLASPSSTTTSGPSHSGTNVGAIAGGVVGGVMGLLAVAGIILCCIRRNRGTNRYSPGMLIEAPETNMTQSVPAYVFSGEPTEAPKLYNPDDPSTFPLPHSPGPSNTTFMMNTQTSSLRLQPPGAYTGAPEV